MSVYDFYQRKTKVNGNSTGKNYSTLGEKLKSDSDTLMELTWNGDLQSKIGYIYDYIHDDQPDIKDHMTYENTTKTRIDVKLIVKSYSSLDQDQPEFYCQFKPSQKLSLKKMMNCIITKQIIVRNMVWNFQLNDVRFARRQRSLS